ncbi:MAG: secretin and TonB N-terminal domain-containing protein [Candidatus Marinimicrobia bacterium]|nr:secretin and TonB N-terminal domain-containing protein [Candidatus Neomarinimicrobiota bacterium]
MRNKLLTAIIICIQTAVFGQWSDPAYSKIDPDTQESERYRLMDKMSINLKNSDIRNVLTMIGELTGLNIVISPNIQDTITANLEDVTVRAALDAILKPNNYSYFVQDNIIIVKDLDTQLIGELESVVIRLKYINSNDLQAPLSTVLTARGTVQSFLPVASISGQTGPPNMAIVSDVQENIPRILSMVKQLDKPIKNINISIKFIETQLDTSKSYGLDWTSSPVQLGGSGNDTINFPISMNNITVATINPSQLTSALKIMQARGKSKLLSSPQVTTLDNHQAVTEVTTTVYIEGLSSGNTNNAGSGSANQTNAANNFTGMGFYGAMNTVQEKDIGIKLQVTPRINENNIITLLVDATVEALLSAAEISTDKPRSTKRTVQTQVSVYNGETVIVGGLIAETIIRNKKFVPILSAIPIIGYFFKTTSVQREQRELLMFITPTIID